MKQHASKRKRELELYVYKPILSNPALACRKTSCIGEWGVIVCVRRRQGIMENGDLHYSSEDEKWPDAIADGLQGELLKRNDSSYCN